MALLNRFDSSDKNRKDFCKDFCKGSLKNRSKFSFALSLLVTIGTQSCLPLAAMASPGNSFFSLGTTFGAAAAGESPVVRSSSVDVDLNQPLVADDPPAQAAAAPSTSSTPSTPKAGEPSAIAAEAADSTASVASNAATKASESEDNNQTVSITQSSRQRFSLPANGLLNDGAILRGGVTEDSSKSPIIQGVVEELPKGTKVSMISQCSLNSQLSQTGDAVTFRIAHDVRDGKGNRVVVPGDWVAHGFVTQATKPGRNGVPGRVDVKISKIVSPDGNYELPFECKISSADNKIAAVSKLIYRDAKFVTVGAVAGSILSFQMTGIGTAVATHGISVGIGAAAGATFGAICAAWRKGDIAALYPNDELKLVTSDPIALPGFNPVNLPSAAPKKTLEGLRVSVKEHRFAKNDFIPDKSARLLYVTFSVVNNSDHQIDKRMLRVVSDKGVHYTLDFRSAQHGFNVPAKEEKTDTLCFNVDLPKNKYYLVLLDSKGDEFKRVPIN